MKWITSERVKVDRVACPWLIKKFVDQDAEFIFVPADNVMAEAKRLDAIPYDVEPRPPRKGMLIRGNLEEIQADQRSCPRAARQDRERRRHR